MEVNDSTVSSGQFASTLVTATGSHSGQTIDGCVCNGLMSTELGKLIGIKFVFSGKSCFILWGHDVRIRFRRYAGECCLPECLIEQHSGLTPGVMVPQNLSEIYLLPPKTLSELIDSHYPPQVAPYLKYLETYMGSVKMMKPAPFVKSHSSLPPNCFYFNVLGKNENHSMSIKKTRFLTETELHLRGIHIVDVGRRLDAQLNMGQISVHSRHNFNNPFLTGVSVENGKNIILRVRQLERIAILTPKNSKRTVNRNRAKSPVTTLHINFIDKELFPTS
ncbi:uncharacterized protein TNCV_3468631 [Trichonephila clavipes]|nr:uncharacterized protein TNCV_3468631 [Trichonephila clavipes]